MKEYRRFRKDLAVYTALFAVGFAACWLGVWLDGSSPVWQTDGLMQHYPFMVYVGRWVRAALSGTVQNFDFALGFGEDVVSALNYYGLGDPLLMLIAAVFGDAQSELAYFVLMLARSWCAGLACIALARHFRWDCRSVVFSGVTYALSISLFSAALIRQAMFANPYICLPLMLLGVECAMDRKRPWVLAAAVALAALGGAYFLYCSSLLMLIYAVVRHLTRGSEHPWRTLPAVAGRAIGWYMLGLGLSAVVFLPATWGFLHGQRLSGGLSLKEFRWVYSLKEYLRFPLALTTHRTAGAVQMLTMPALLGAAARLLQFRREDRSMRTLLAAALVLLLLPATGLVLNGFAYEATRWSYGISLLAAMLGGWGLNALLAADGRVKKLSVVTGGLWLVYLAAVVLLDWAGSVKFLIGYAAALLLTLAAVWMISAHRRIGAAVLAVAVLVNLSAAHLGVWQGRRGEMMISGESREQIFSSAYSGLGETASFGRTDMTASASGVMLNGSALEGIPGTTWYNSTISGTTFRFMNDTANAGLVHVNAVVGLDRRAALEALWSVNRYLGGASLPFGFHEGGENEYALPVGYAYTGAVSMADYEAMSPLEKQWALLQGAVTDETTLPAVEISQSLTEIPVENIEMDGILEEDGVLEVGEGGVIRLTFDAPAGCELYLEMKGLAFPDGRIDLGNRVLVSSGAADTEFCLIQDGFELDLAREAYWVNIGYDEDARTAAEIRFARAGTYRLEGLALYAQPMQDFPGMIARLQTRGLQDVSVGTDCVRGTVSLDEPGVMQFSIPYSAGWTAIVDGEEVPTLCTAGTFLAIGLSPGNHEIQLTYRTPLLRAGLALTVLSALALILFSRRKEHKL